jgi:hypothetical protein
VSWYERQQERRVDAVVSPSSPFPSVDLVQGRHVSVRASEEEAALGIVRGLPIGDGEDDEPGPS